MSIPLHFNGSFQITESNSAASALLRFKSKASSLVYDGLPPIVIIPTSLHLLSKSFQTTIDVMFNHKIPLQFTGSSLMFIGNYNPNPIVFNAARMFMMFN